MLPLRIEQLRPAFSLLSICLAALMLPLSFSGGAMATPSIAAELPGSALLVTAITNGFMLSFGCLLLAAGTIADRLGRKTVFCWASVRSRLYH
ncbi:hypothetical protein VPH49_25800 [Pseudomonas luteola]|uniref:hypothetical protein n=1 Tax=Pseudomonas luteola TaxID=47886 RepID=UPI003A8446AB